MPRVSCIPIARYVRMERIMRKYRFPWRSYVLLDINPVVRFLILSDFVWMGAVGLVVPIFALLIEDSIVGASAAVVGAAASIYLITKSIVQVFAASVVDWIRGERDDFWVLFIFSLLAAVLPILYLFMQTPLHLFMIQFAYGLFAAFTFPTFMAIFTRHVDQDKAGTEWGIYYTFNDLSTAFTAFVGGVIATYAGFHILIIFSVTLSVMGVIVLWGTKRFLYRSSRSR